MDEFHDHHSGCGCDPGEIYHANAIAMARVMDNPVAALRDISNGNPESVLFQSVVNLTLKQPSIWRSGAATLYIRYILHGYTQNCANPSVGQDPHWAKPLMGLINVLAGIAEQKSEHQDTAILDELRGSYSAICAVIWHDLSALLPPGPQADYTRHLVVSYISNMLLATSKKYVSHVTI